MTLANPAVVVVGGPWGTRVLAAITAACDRLPRRVAVAAASVVEPSLAGARVHALDRLRSALVSATGPRSSAK